MLPSLSPIPPSQKKDGSTLSFCDIVSCQLDVPQSSHIIHLKPGDTHIAETGMELWAASQKAGKGMFHGPWFLLNVSTGFSL